MLGDLLPAAYGDMAPSSTIPSAAPAAMYHQLLRVRLRWYIRTSGELVLRHWQWFVLACLIVPGTPFVSVFRDAAAVLAASVSSDMTVAQRLFVATVIDVAAILWILPQRHALSGGAFMRYVGALPVSRGVRLCVEATLLLAANNLILVSAAIAVVQILASLRDAFAACNLLILLCLAGTAQHATLTRRPIVVLGVILGNAALAGALAEPASGVRWMAPIAALGSAGIAMLIAEHFAHGRGSRVLGFVSRSAAPVLRVLSSRAPTLLLQCKTLAERPAQTGFRIGAALALAFGTDRLMATFHFDRRAVPTAILAMAAISLLLAGFYRMLRDARSAMASYLAALPLPPRYWPVRDTKFVLLLNGVPLVILLSPQIARGLLSLLLMFGLAMAYQVLLALLRWPIVHGGRRSLLYAVLLSVLWSGAAIAAVSR